MSTNATPGPLKLIIQIPCLNEAESLPLTVQSLPRQVAGFDTVEWLVIDDGSTDGTAEVARRLGVDHVVRHTGNRGLARAFTTGLDACLRLGASVVVNTDADNQYRGEDIPLLVEPILAGRADYVIGSRPIATIMHFSPLKRLLQRLGSAVVRTISQTDVADAPSGFRAMSRALAQRLFVFGSYSYTLETIIQAGQANFTVVSVPIGVNPDLRPSRLVRSTFSYVVRSGFTIIRIFAIYRPARFFSTIAFILLAAAGLIGLRFLLYIAAGEGDGHVQSLILAGVLATAGFQTLLFTVIADLLAANRKLLEDIRWRQYTARDRDGNEP